MLKMAKFSINVPDEYAEALTEWAESLGDNRGSLVSHLLRLCCESQYPDRFPRVPGSLPSAQVTTGIVPPNTLLSQQLTLASNLEGRVTSIQALAVKNLREYFEKFTSRYHTAITSFANTNGLTFEAAYVLLTQRSYPYSAEDIEWAKSQPTILTEAQFLAGQLGQDRPSPGLES